MDIKLVTKINELKEIIKQWKQNGQSIGYVPTMGALHAGHQSLIQRAVTENDVVVVSIFVNPTQFGPTEDYDAYPRDLAQDTALCSKAGANVIFHPDPEELYFPNRCTSVHVSGLTDVLCGKKRPGHFDGVCLVVSKFFHIITPDKAYFGQKDAQQVIVLQKMVQDLNFDVEIVSCPIVRESDGLAKSSRNQYLSPEERTAALILNQSLKLAKGQLEQGQRNAPVLKKLIQDTIKSEPLATVDYIEIVENRDLTSIKDTIDCTVLVAIAVYIGKTRLIDNFIFELNH